MYRLFTFLGQSFINGWSAFQFWFRHLRGQFSPTVVGLVLALILAIGAGILAAVCKCLPMLIVLLSLIGLLVLVRAFERLVLIL